MHLKNSIGKSINHFFVWISVELFVSIKTTSAWGRVGDWVGDCARCRVGDCAGDCVWDCLSDCIIGVRGDSFFGWANFGNDCRVAWAFWNDHTDFFAILFLAPIFISDPVFSPLLLISRLLRRVLQMSLADETHCSGSDS
jgi:hypothetical protein